MTDECVTHLWNDNDVATQKYTKKFASICPPKIPDGMALRLNPGLRGERLANNILKQGRPFSF
jgi:hypothetical protein